MSKERIEAVLACQSQLIAAIGEQDPQQIVQASEALAGAVSALGDVERWPDDADLGEQLRAVLEHNRKAAMQVNSLAHWTRQRIDRLAEVRGQAGRDRRYKAI